MKRYFTRILAVVCCLVASLSANAQYSKVFESYPKGYNPTLDAAFELTAIAETLGTDTATLNSALTSWFGGSGSTNLIFLEGPDGTRYDNYTQGGKGGFWMTAQGTPTGWTGDVGDDVWYNTFSISPVDNALYISIGQHPDALTGGEELKAKFVLVFNEKEATFDITLKVLKLDLPEATNLLSKLTIVDRKSTVVEQWARSNTKGDTDTLDFKGIAAALGTTPALFSEAIGKMTYARKADEGDNPDTYGFKTDTLTNVTTSSNAPGWWFAAPFDGYDEFVSVASTQGKFYAEAFALDSESEQLTFNIGQMGGEFPILVDGQDPIDQAMCKVYFIYGDKAVELSITLKIVERDIVPFAEMTEVGSETVELSQYPTTDYSSVSFSLDLDAISSLLECEVADISLWAAIEGDDISDTETATKGGFWFNKEGYSAGHGNNSGIYVEPDVAGDYSKFNVGQYPSAFEGGETAVATIYLVNGDKYYKVDVKMEIKIKEGPSAEFVSVANRAVKIQIVPASNYSVEMNYYIDPSDYELIGTTTPTLYGQKDPGDGSEWTDGYTDSYTCTPYPGFWMSKEGYPRGWNTSADDYSPWGVTYADDLFTFYQMPNHNQVGDTYNATLYLVNEETGKMISYLFDIKFVSNVIPQAEVVGTETLWLPVKADSHTYTEVDLTTVLEKLELENARQLEAINSLSVLMEDGTMSEPMATSNGAQITDKGYLDMTETFTDAHVNIEFNIVTGTNQMAFDVEEWLGQWDNDTRIVTKIGFQKENKIYIFNITFVSEEVYTRIAEAKSNASKAAIFDLSGRRVENAGRGVYIVNGKKMVK